MEISYSVVLFTALLLGGVQDVVNGQTLCSSKGDSVQPQLNTSVLHHDTLGYISQSVTGVTTGNLLGLFTNSKFECYGSIHSWSGLIHLDTGSGALSDHSIPLMHLQVWRPCEERTSFTLVGSSSLMLDSVNTNITVQNDTVADGNWSKFYYEFNVTLGGNSKETEEIYFQPRDVVGCYIPAHTNPPGVTFRNITRADEIGMDPDLMLFSTTRLNCKVSLCDESIVMIGSVLPQVFPNYIVNGGEEEMMKESGQEVFMCNNESITLCNETTSCNDCSSVDSSSKIIPGLLAIIAAVCLATVCIVGIVSNTIILCCAKHKAKKKKHHIPEREVGSNSPCRCIVNPQAVQTELPTNIRSLAEFLQYNMMNETTTESFNVSWV